MSGESSKKLSAKDMLKKGVAAAKPQKSNMTAYGAIGVAALLGLYFFSGPKIPDADRSGLEESDGVVIQRLPSSITGVSSDLHVDSLEAESVTTGAEDSEVGDSGGDADTNPATQAAAGGVALGVAEVPVGAGSQIAVAATPQQQPTNPALAGTSAANATLPAMFSASGGSPGLMVPAETVVASRPEPAPAAEQPPEETLQERADKGDADAMYEIAMTGISNEDAEAVKKRFRYLQAAASKGSVPAMREVAGLHERGEGVLASERMAYVWATLASAFGEDMASFRDRLAAKMSEDELESGQRAAAATLKGFGSSALEKAKAYKAARKS